MTATRILWLAFAVYGALIGAFLVSELATAGSVGPPIDDGWIYMAFARSLAVGEGITYPGYDGSLCAVTGPIWNAMLALLFVLFGATPLVAKSCGILTGAFAIWAVYRLGQSATGDRKVGAIAALVVACSPRFVWGALSVMEVPFFVATVGWGLALHLDRREQSLGRWLPALVVLWLSGWARPECFVFPAIVALHRFGWRELGITLALLALYPAYHLAAYGHPLPTTFYAKASGGAPWSILARDGFGAALSAVVMNPLEQIATFVGYLPTFLPVLALGALPGLLRGMRERSGVVFVVLAMTAFIVARGVLGVAQPHFQYGRYFGHVFALFAVVCVYGFDGARVGWKSSVGVLSVIAVSWIMFSESTQAYVFDWVGTGVILTEDDANTIAWVGPMVGAGIMLLGALQGRPARPPMPLAAAFLILALVFGGVRHGRNVNDTYTMNVAMAQKIGEVVPEDERVACHDIGAIGFFSDRLMLDLAGLGSPEVVFGPRLPNGRIDGQRILTEVRPKWLCLTQGMFDAVMGGRQQLPGLAGFELVHSIDHPANVTLLGTNYFLAKLTWE